ncbi:hypothetical protein RBB77_14080 [Tunturibacter psychrotolerans]|uniref:Uncharacterized protein n=1 Tax=Tunturiibacter psychrotolerans TaxID=3069686 RepID=A0AAU7ZKX0_9BACT
MTTHTRHPWAASDPTATGVELLDLADSAASGVLTDIDEVRYEIVEVISWLEVEYGTISVFDAGVAFEMTDVADAVSPNLREFHRIDDRCLSARCKMLPAVTVTALTSNAGVFKG